MAPLANIVKKIYLNNRRWDAVDTTSIQGTLDAWGPSPTSISFSVNRHFDTHQSDTGIEVPNAPAIAHLDNIKLFIAPASANVDWPEFYYGKCNHGENAVATAAEVTGGAYWSADPIQQYLRWQGLYLEPSLQFTPDDESTAHSEAFAVECFDYRHCLNRCLARFRNIAAFRWDSDQIAGNFTNVSWQAHDPEVTVGYDMTYNARTPRGQSQKKRAWVQLCEHLLLHAVSTDVSDANGAIAPHIPDYVGEGHRFAVAPSFWGLRLDADGNERQFDIANYSAADAVFAPGGNEQTDREFQVNPITINGDYLLDALAKITGAVGNFDFYLDCFNGLHWVRIKPQDEVPVPTGLERINRAAFSEYGYTAAGHLYLCHFADDDGAVVYGRHYNVRAVDGLKPRAVPEANRVIGVLTGKPPVAHAIANHRDQDNPDGFSAGTLQTHVLRLTDPDYLDKLITSDGYAVLSAPSGNFTIKAYIRKPYKMSHAVGKIRRPTSIIPYLYKYKGATVPQQGGLPGEDLNFYTGGPVEVVSGDYTFRFRATFAVFPASVAVFESATDRARDDSDSGASGSSSGDVNGPYPYATGGHYIRLTEPAYTVVDLTLLDWNNTTTVGGASVNTPFLAPFYIVISHPWSARGARANHSVSYRGQQYAGSAYNEATDHFGIFNSAEYWTVDSSEDSPAWQSPEDLRMWDALDNLVFPGLGEFTRAVIDAPLLQLSVEDLLPTYESATDAAAWSAAWSDGKKALKRAVRKEALQLRQLVTTGDLPILYDAELALPDFVCVLGTRDDQFTDAALGFAMRLKSMRGRIDTIKLTPNDELVLSFTTARPLQKFSVYEMLRKL